MTDPRAAHEAAWRGDFSGVGKAAAALARVGGDEARAWEMALAAAAWHAGAGGALPARQELVRVGLGPAALPACLAAVHGAHAALLGLDRAALEGWIEVLARLAPASGDTEAAAWLEVIAAFADLWAGRGEAASRARAAGALSARAKVAPLVVEATALSALAALEAGAQGDAVALARRASRMARTEALPWPEYLANVVLARVRRHSGKPHMAIHILRALRKVVPAPWHPWVAWESGLAAGPAEASTLASAGPVGLSLGELLDAARRGDRRAFDRGVVRCRAAVAAVAPLAAELDALVVALDPEADARGAPPALAAWLAGAAHDVPAGLQGLASPGLEARAEDGGFAPAAFVVARPGRPARRVLGLAAALAGGAADPGRRPGRSEAAISALALAGPSGATRAELFAGVYGFAYVPVRHQGVLDVLLHRVRGEIAPAATLEKRGERLVLEAPAGIVVPDPRCGGPEDDQLLRVLAARGGGTAKGAAEALGIPLRTAQAALQALVHEGVCISERKGRVVEYRVEDTTFSEPTQR